MGGYVYNEPVAATDGQSAGQTGTSPAPFPFETEVLVTTAGAVHSFQRSVQGPDMNGQPAAVKPLSQSLDMATGELTTLVRFGATDSSWCVSASLLLSRVRVDLNRSAEQVGRA